MQDNNGHGPVGYSDRISDPAYQVPEVKSDGRQSLRYLLFIVPVAVIVLLWRSGVYGTGIFALLMVITVIAALPPILRERRQLEDHTYDGTVESVARREPVSSADARRIDPKTRQKLAFHTIRIVGEDGKLRTYERTAHMEEDYRTYYRTGDRVRHHRGFELPEKYDKSADDVIVCIVCGQVCPMDARKCGECGAPLLK